MVTKLTQSRKALMPKLKTPLDRIKEPEIWTFSTLGLQ